MSQYIVSARKYRPDSFETLIGQDNIAQTLKNSILRGQLAHAYLFCGPRGVGKTTTARIFAKMINCSNPSEQMEPCGQCESCESFAEGRSFCIHELDAASNNGVDDIKSLMDQVRIPPQVGKYSVYIIDEVHMLSQSAFNAFLKTLEEPPAHAVFILATTEKHKILPTILSRCQTYDFNRITVDNIVKNLRMVASREGVVIDDESLHVIAHKADGAMRDALTIFDQTVAFCGTDVKYQDVLRNLNVLDYEYSFNLVDAFLKGDYQSAMLIFDEVLTKGFNALHFVAALSSHLRDLIVSKSGGMDSLLELPDSLKIRYCDQAASCSLRFLYDALSVTTQCESGYRASVNARLHIEFALMKLAFLVAAPALAAQPAPAVQPAAQAPVAAAQPAVQSVSAPAAPSPAPEAPAAQPAPVPASQPAPAAQSAPAPVASPVQTPVQATQSPAVAETQEKPKERRTRASRAGVASVSLKSMMEGNSVKAANVALDEESAVPTDEEILAKWPELAKEYSDKPRLSSTLSAAKLNIVEDSEVKKVFFKVANQSQKEWIESKLLSELEAKLHKLLSSSKVLLRVEVEEETEQKTRQPYMPSEKATELMKENEQVRTLVTDLGLDIL